MSSAGRSRRLRRATAAIGVGTALIVLAACSSGGSGSGAAPSTPAAAPATGAAAAGTSTPAVLSAANAFLATLDDTQRDTVLFDWTDTEQKQRWSNFPPVAFQRAGLMWGDLAEPQQNAWLALMRASLSTEGYDRVLAEWTADDANATLTGRPELFGRRYYYVALIGTPSDTGPFMWQFGGHHLAVNITVAGGRVSATPSFLGDQPASYPDAAGTAVRPLGDIESESFALVNSLDGTQRRAAVLGSTPINLVLGPGEDGRTIAPEGLPIERMTARQRASALRLIGHYTGLVNDTDAAARRAEIESTLDQTYFAWYGPTTEGSAAYFRVTGPTLVIEYAPQGAGGGPGGGGGGDADGGAEIAGATVDHVHGIYRDPTNEYGAKYA